MADWVSVKERLPDGDYDCQLAVLVVTEHWACHDTAEGYLGHDALWHDENGTAYDNEWRTVTHWRRIEMPEPPEGVTWGIVDVA